VFYIICFFTGHDQLLSHRSFGEKGASSFLQRREFTAHVLSSLNGDAGNHGTLVLSSLMFFEPNKARVELKITKKFAVLNFLASSSGLSWLGPIYEGSSLASTL
jgi:hypothetical protein